MKEKPDMLEKPEYAVPAVDRMLDIVEFLLEHPRPFGVTELARELEVPTNSVFRILRRLAERGYAEVDPESGGYRLGAGFFRLGMRLSTRYDLRLRARRHLEWLCQQTGETVQLHVRSNGHVMVLDVVNAPVEFFLQIVLGSRMDYHCNAFGKCILAFLDEEEVRKILPPRLPARTPNTITTLPRLFEDFAATRQTGLAYDWEEYAPGIICIGAPVFDVHGKVIAGAGMTGMAGRFDKSRRKTLEKLVLQAAARISQDMAYTGDFFTKLGVEIETVSGQ
ncbi:MAG TPA: IclR family transcriptional regulator [Planctomycetota bacterium]